MNALNSKKTCICGKTHRAGTVCEKAQRMMAAAVDAQRVVDALRRLPKGTVTIVDSRRGITKARTLSDGEVYARGYADGCTDTSWGESITSEDGTEVRYARATGGMVSNSYGYAASADYMACAAGDGRVLVLLSRGRARSAPGGKGNWRHALEVSQLVLSTLSPLAETFDAGLLLAAKTQANTEKHLKHLISRGSSRTAEETVEMDALIEQGFCE